MPIMPNAVERAAFLRLHLAPGPLLEILNALSFRVVLAGVKLGIFDALAKGPATADAVAAAIGADARATRITLDALEPLGYVKRDGRGLYRNTAMTSKWLVRDAGLSFAAGFEFWEEGFFTFWRDLETSIRAGKPAVDFYAWIASKPDVSARFQAWMTAIAALGASEVVAKVPIPAGAKSLIDVGGGHASYAIAFARAHPSLNATVVDAPHALAYAAKNVDEAGLASRIALAPGDFWTTDLGRDHDVALLFNVVHGMEVADMRALVRRTADALAPGGRLVVMEQLEGAVGGSAPKAATRLMSLNYLHMIGGVVHRYEDVARALGDAGLAKPRRTKLLRTPGTSLVIATKP
ncbi:MAG TPA: methyltransferase [Candidatus Thermoplasmatota archaeon]|nr:methyltransferase [Candidatus Thermoplasmatota archaeon]